MGSPNGSLPDLEGTGYRASTMEEKINEMFVQIAKLPLLMQGISRFESCVQTLSHSVASYDSKITNIEQMVSSLAARVTTLETNATNVSSGSGSARSWNMLGQSTGSTATGSLGSHSPGHPMTIGIQDADLIHPQALRMNMRDVPSYHGSVASNTTKGLRSGSTIFWKNPTCQPTTDLLQFIVQQVPRRSGLYLNREPNVKTSLFDIRMMVFLMTINSPFCVTTTITVR